MNTPRSGAPATRSRVRMYSRASSRANGGIWQRSSMRCLSCCSVGDWRTARSSGWPTRTICSSLVFGVSKFESRRICSSVCGSRLCASSSMRMVAWPIRSRSRRKLLRARSRCERDSMPLAMPKSSRMHSRMPSKSRLELTTKATAVWPSSRCRSACSSVVFPVPIRPVRTLKPLRSRVAYTSWASASRWAGLI